MPKAGIDPELIKASFRSWNRKQAFLFSSHPQRKDKNIYKNLENYFNDCENCGQCCKLPGIFLPEQLERLADSFNLSLEKLFRTYLIAELFSPGGEMEPVFILSPVKVDEGGERMDTFFADGEYHRLRHLHCIFWNSEKKGCNIYDKKPFGCNVLLCSKMTESEPILLRKEYYYHKWQEYQHILFEIFPELEEITFELKVVSSSGRRGVAEVTSGLNQASALS